MMRNTWSVLIVCVSACIVAAMFSRLPAQIYTTVPGSGPLNVDCTGATDMTTALQAAVNAMPDAGSLFFPLNCKVKLGTGISSGCGITVTNRVGVQFVSNVMVGNFGGGQSPQLIWNGSGGKMWCVNSTDHPRFIGLVMTVSNTGNMDSCITFDGDPSTHIGTQGVVDWFTCNNGSNTNANFVGISISPTALSNHENYEISHGSIGCSGPEASLRARDGVTTSGSPNVSSASAAFIAGDVGKPINISYPGENLQTTVLSVTDATHVVLNANVPDTKTQATIITGQSYGVGIRNGASQNALQQTFSRISYNRCHVGIQLQGGNAELSHINGGQSDTGIFVGLFAAEQVSINWYEAENDLRGIDSSGPLLMVTNSRLSNGNQYGDGFLRFGGRVNIQNTFDEFATPAGAVLIGQDPVTNAQIAGISNVWRQSTYALTGLNLFKTPPITSINDDFSGIAGAPGGHVFGCWAGSPNSCVTVNNSVGHPGGSGLTIASTNFYADATTPVIGLNITDTLGLIGSYVGVQVTPSTGTAGVNVPFRSVPAAFSVFAPCSGTWEGGSAAITDSTTATWGATIAGTSNSHVFGYCDGTNWTVTGK